MKLFERVVYLTVLSRGRSLFEWENDFMVIDIETTGLVPDYDEIIELSALRVRNNNIVDSYSALVKPNYEIDDFITKLTGISNDMLSNEKSIRDVITDYYDFIGSDILVGHNLSFDLEFINKNLEKLKRPLLLNDYIDTLRLSRKIVKETQNHRLITLTNYFKIDNPTHRGLADCHSAFHLYGILYKKCLDDGIDLKTITKTKCDILNSIVATVDINKVISKSDNYFFEKDVVVTGKLDSMTKYDAGQMVVNVGGRFSDSVSKDTEVLVLGNSDYQNTHFAGKSNKQKKAEELILKGYEIDIIDERIFLELIKTQ
jgi:DNA polymerase-3 subunit epsilon